jgi:hypothetical protein
LARAENNTLFYFSDNSDTPIPLDAVKSNIAKLARIDPNQTVRIMVGPGVPAEDFFHILHLFTEQGLSHVSLIQLGEAEKTNEFYLRVFQFQNEDYLGMQNFDEVRAIFIDGKPYIKHVEQSVAGYPPQGVGSPEP